MDTRNINIYIYIHCFIYIYISIQYMVNVGMVVEWIIYLVDYTYQKSLVASPC